MSKLFLNFSNMKKLKETKDSTIFEHKDGHQIHVKNSALTPKMREEMQKLALGKKGKEEAVKKQDEMQKFADGGPAAPLDIEPVQQDAPAPPVVDQNIAPVSNAPGAPLEVEAINPADMEEQPNPAPNEAAGTPVSQDPTRQPASQDAGPANQPATPAVQPQTPTPGGMVQSAMQRGISEVGAGIQQEAAAKTQIAKDTAAALQNGQIDKETSDMGYQQLQQSLLNERQSILKEMNEHQIHPDQFWADKSVPAKITSAIGLILGGIGGGLTHQGNPAMDFINKQIDRNIAAQQSGMDQRKNMLSANLAQFGNIDHAREFNRVLHNDQIANMIQSAAAKSGGQLAQSEAQKAIGQLHQDSAFRMAQIGAEQTINGNGRPSNTTEGDVNSAISTLRMVSPDKAKEAETRLLPGIGTTRVPLDASTRSTIVERNTLDKNISDLISFQKQYGGTLEGIADPSIRKYGQALALQVQDAYRRGNQQGVFKPAEAAFVNGVIGDEPSSLFSKFSKAPGYRAAAQINKGNLNQIYSSVGLQPFQSKQQTVQQQSQTPIPRFKAR